MELVASQQSETLGQAIIPAINKLQDIFSQVRWLRLTWPLQCVLDSFAYGVWGCKKCAPTPV